MSNITPKEHLTLIKRSIYVSALTMYVTVAFVRWDLFWPFEMGIYEMVERFSILLGVSLLSFLFWIIGNAMCRYK